MATTLPTESFDPAARPIAVEIIALLNRRLSDAVDLESRCREAEWNVHGEAGSARRELFSTIRHEAGAFADTLASRIVELGGVAEGTPRVVAQRSGLLEILPISSRIDPEIGPVHGALIAFASRIRIAVHEASRRDDDKTAGICARISRAAENGLRRLKSHSAGAAGAA